MRVNMAVRWGASCCSDPDRKKKKKYGGISRDWKVESRQVVFLNFWVLFCSRWLHVNTSGTRKLWGVLTLLLKSWGCECVRASARFMWLWRPLTLVSPHIFTGSQLSKVQLCAPALKCMPPQHVCVSVKVCKPNFNSGSFGSFTLEQVVTSFWGVASVYFFLYCCRGRSIDIVSSLKLTRNNSNLIFSLQFGVDKYIYFDMHFQSIHPCIIFCLSEVGWECRPNVHVPRKVFLKEHNGSVQPSLYFTHPDFYKQDLFSFYV